MRDAFRYAEKVAEGKIVAGKLVRLSCERHLRDLETATRRGLVFDAAAADKVLRFFPSVLRHSKGEWAGQPVVLEDWQKFRFASLFGWKRRDSGLRRFRTSYTAVARKNGKSTDAAGFGLYMLTGDGEPGAEVFSYATKRDQARIVWGQAKSMVRRSPAMSKRLKCTMARIVYPATESWFEALGADQDTLDGLNVHGAIGDELHAQKTAGPYDVIDTAMGSRRQPIHNLITTRGSNRAGICGDLDEYSIRVLRGDVHDDRWFAYIAAIDEEDDWLDEKCWVKANPNLGVSVKVEDLRRLATVAGSMASRSNEFKRKRCNLWTGSLEAWIAPEVWKACSGEVDDDLLRGCPVWLGLDLSSVNDLTALAMLYELDDGRLVLRCRYFVPEKGVQEREDRDRVPYSAWIAAGWIETTPGATVDRRWVGRRIAEIQGSEDVQGLAYDRWRVAELIDELEAIGVRCQRVKPATDENDRLIPFLGDGLAVIDTGQGFKDMNPCIEAVEHAIGSGRFSHGANPVTTMCVSNAYVQIDDAGGRKFSKRKATGRIDGIVAAAMACGLRNRLGRDAARGSYLSGNGLLSF